MKFSLWPDSIKARVTLSALGVFLLSLWVLAFFTTRILERDIRQLVADTQASATSQVAAQLDRELSSRLAALERIAAEINADMIENPNAVQHLLETQPLLQDLFNVSVLALNKSGISIADVPLMAERIGIKYRDRIDAFAVALDEGQTNIGNPLIAPTIGVPLIPLAVPIRDHTGNVIGALGGAIDLSKPNFFDDLTTQSYGRSGYFSVISKSRRIVVTSSNPDLIMAELPQVGVRPTLDRAIRGEEGSEHYISMQGIDSLATAQGLEVTDWLIATITPISEAYKPIKDMQQRMTLITLVVTLLVGSVIWWVLQRQLRPILSTVEVLGQMTEQDQSWKSLPLTTGNEINKLIGSFNRLLQIVAEREQETRRFKTMIDNAAYGKAMTDLEGNLVYINRFFAEIHGYTPAELLGKNLSIFHTASQLEHVKNLVSQLRQDGYFSSSEVWHVHRHGTEFPMLMSTITLKDDDGNPQYMATSAVDITKQKQTEESLRESMSTFKKLFDDSADAILLISNTGVFIECNQAALNLVKMSHREFINRTPTMISPEFQPNGRRSSEAAQDMINQAHAKGLHRFDWTCVNSEGGEFIVDVSLMPIIINGQTMLHNTWRDITERKRAEEERESLRKTAEALAEVFLGLGREPQQNMDRIVRAACEVTGSVAALYNRLDDTGCSLEVWSGHQLPPDMPRADAPQGHICYEATIHGQDRTVVIGNLEGTDYERTDPAVGKYGLKAYLGHPIHLRGVAIGALAVVDIRPRSFTPGEIGAVQMLAKALSLEEERYFAEQDLKQSEERFRGILQNVDTVAVQGYSIDGTVRYWNRASESFYGYTAEEAFGRNLLDLIIPPAMRGEVSAAMQHMAQTGEAIPSSELALMRKDGSLIPVYSAHVMVQVAGKEIELYCIDIDLTELKQAEEEKQKLHDQLHQAQKIESVGRLAGGVAHDFNNMLGVILGYAQLAMRRIGPEEPLYANLEAIRKAAERSSSLTRQLLAFARKQTVAPKMLDLNETVNDMFKMLRRLIGEDIDLGWRPGLNLGSVFIDPSQLDQILTNLCVNARDAVANMGKITIETASICFDEAYCVDHADVLPGDFVMLAVSDDGCGMDTDILEHIFEPFFSTKEMGKGTGLGLATIHGIVKQNSGFISVYSEPGHGTTFKIYLPQHADRAAPRPEPEQTPVPLAGGETILLVEDEPAILEMTTIMLEEMGYAVISAGSPGAAIRLAGEHPGRIDLLMTDVVMPEMNGRDLAGNLMSIYPDIRCLFMSGYTANVIAHHGVLDPGVHFLQKPFSIQDLAAKIRSALESEEATRKNG